ncbi:serine/threonine dehydratase [Paraglaciecola polaris]|uniref:Threonine dehydratase n=1 Tax=Paraglaciecola polaris LMG 21857 TaxID=1129793 RepID=K6Z8B3_9ALTE|nr:serine/threonine dehydratase [Paraglaciecola polaris]GAC32401.1 threonine dehydratase [Paraglaciecola polaris LMG 21857]
MPSVTFTDISAARQRIASYVHTSDVISSSLLNSWLGHEVFFKTECLQRTGAFKLRGALNTLLHAREHNQSIKRVVASSSGNHAQAVAYAASLFNLPVTIYSAQNISKIKAAATRSYGAELRLFPLREEADNAVAEAAKEPGILWIPPFNHPNVIAGQGTVAAEAFEQTADLNALFMPCGGGGLASGSMLATRQLSPGTKVIACEPLAGNDAAQSLRLGSIQCLQTPAKTLADGAATPAVGEHTYPLLQQLDGFYEVDEVQIAYWTQWLQHLLKLHIEPTSAMSMHGVVNYLAAQSTPQRVMVILSGGNIDAQKMQQIWQDDHLLTPPSLPLIAMASVI